MVPSSQRRSSKFNLVHAFNFGVPAGRPEDEGEEENKDEDEGESGDDDTGDDTGSASGEVKDPEKKRLSDEAAKHRTKAKQLQDELDKATKWRREQEDKDKSELELAQRTAQEQSARAETAEREREAYKVELSFFKSGSASQFRDPADALKFLDLGSLEKDDDGSIVASAMKKAVEDLVKEKPYLARSADDDDFGSDDQQPSGDANSGKRRRKTDTTQQALIKKFPALASKQ